MTKDQWFILLVKLGVRQLTAQLWSAAFADQIKPERFNLGWAEIDDALAQLLHESDMLGALVENMNYSADRLREMGAMMPGGRWAAAAARADEFAHHPEALANFVYGGRLGNTEPNDGWNFRGQGLPQITGRANFERVGVLIGQDLTVNPSLLQQPHYALQAFVAWWEDRIPDSAIDHPDRVRKLVQGGTVGLDHTRALAAAARAEIAALAA